MELARPVKTILMLMTPREPVSQILAQKRSKYYKLMAPAKLVLNTHMLMMLREYV